LEKLLYDNSASDYDEMKTLSEKLATLTQTIDTATERWLELAERID
ncbi:MAG: ABC transporter C-terminal domain-containing protein, partial [Cyanobacteria bacterium P01_C01_bin.70]